MAADLTVLEAGYPPVPDVVALLEARLEEAKRGEIQGVSIAWTRSNPFSGMQCRWQNVGFVKGFGLLGAVDTMHHNLSSSLSEATTVSVPPGTDLDDA